MKQDVALGEIMADRWRDFVVESYQLGGLGLGWPGRGLVGIDNGFPRGHML